VATSANALRVLAERQALERYRHLPVFTVGDQTAITAEALGFMDVQSAQGRLADLVGLVAEAAPEGAIFYPCGQERAGDLAQALAAFRRKVQTTPLYTMQERSEAPAELIERMEDGLIHGAMIYSRRAAEIFMRCFGERLSLKARKGFTVLAISEKAAQPLIGNQFVRMCFAERPDDEAMMSLALSFAREYNAS
jgi:uroporphyrinogen-III synthase